LFSPSSIISVLAEKIILPPKYYLEYFQYLLNFVDKKYQHILSENELFFLKEFRALPEDAQCLFIRFCNRRGAFFRLEKLKYEEIKDIPTVCKTLTDKKFISSLAVAKPERMGELLDIFNKKELLDLAQSASLKVAQKSQIKKEELIDFLIDHIEFTQLIEILSMSGQIVQVNYEAEVVMYRFLFFGSRHTDMSEFVVRDLGYRQYQAFDEDKLVAQFNNRQEVEDRLRVSLAKEDFHLMQENEISPPVIFTWFMDWHTQFATQLSEVALPSYERFLIQMGTYLERKQYFDEAMQIFSMTQQPPARERKIRILHKQKYNEEALQLAEQILYNYYNASERIFALDFIEKNKNTTTKKRHKKSVTIELENAESILLPIDWKYQVEAGAIAHYQAQGWHAAHTENYLWRALFGLLFWDIIFDTEALAIHHPLQRSPSDFYKPIFWEKRRNKLVERIDILNDTEAALEFLHVIFLEKYQHTNPLVEWFPALWSWLEAMIRKLPAAGLKQILLEMAKNLRENTRGFPDLFIWNTDSYHFIEIKSPTDSLSNQQLFWIRFFATQQVKSQVVKVLWERHLAPDEDSQEPSQKKM
jgi:VRR-NUC domain